MNQAILTTSSYGPCPGHRPPVQIDSGQVERSFQRECCLSEFLRTPMVPESSRTPDL